MNPKDFYPIFLKSTGVCIDTRKLEQNNVFIALKGQNFNANQFANQAIENGAMACIVDEMEYANSDKNIFFVENGLEFLQSLAQYHRQQLKIPFIALTGSNGKTTTKELIAACLEMKYKVAYTKGNFNNHIGVPLTILDIKASDEIAVIEMGANHLGEIAFLCEIAQPNFGYITNFGKAHLEGFGSFEGVVQGKSELYEYLHKMNGKAFIFADDDLQLEKSKALDKISFGFHNKADYSFESASNNGLAAISYDGTLFQTHLNGTYNEPNIAAAASMALHFEVSVEAIQKALKNYEPKLNRSQEIVRNGRKILLDAYNANPSSMEIALSNFAKLDGTKAVILGDMFELGETSSTEHLKIAELALAFNFDDIILIGRSFHQLNLNDKALKSFLDKDDFLIYLKENPIQNQRILVKGSRAMALEKLVDHF